MRGGRTTLASPTLIYNSSITYYKKIKNGQDFRNLVRFFAYFFKFW